MALRVFKKRQKKETKKRDKKRGEFSGETPLFFICFKF